MPLLTAGLGAIILLAGCAGGDSTTQGEIAPAQNPVTSEPGAEIIRNADMSLRVTDVRETVDRIDSITAATSPLYSQNSGLTPSTVPSRPSRTGSTIC